MVDLTTATVTIPEVTSSEPVTPTWPLEPEASVPPEAPVVEATTTEAPPTEAPPTEAPPTEAPPTEAPPSTPSWMPGDGAGSQRGGAGAGSSGGGTAIPRGALEGLRRLSAARPGGSGGGRGRPSRRGDSGGGGRIDLRNSWQILAGSILIPLGVVFILIAWYGAAHTAYVQQQIPYLVSGSFVGLGCLVLGGLLYWAHWLYRIYDQADLHHDEQLRVLETMTRALTERVGTLENGRGSAAVGGGGYSTGEPTSPGVASTSLPPPPSAGASGVTSTGSVSYVVTPAGTVYHLPSCPVVAHHSEGLRVLGAAGVVDMEPCRICLGTP